MDIDEAQQKILKLLKLAAGAPTSEEGRTAAATVCRLISAHGFLIMKPSDLIQSAPVADTAPPHPSSEKKARRKRPTAKEIRETVTDLADTAATAFDAAGRIASAVNGFRHVARGGS